MCLIPEIIIFPLQNQLKTGNQGEEETKGENLPAETLVELDDNFIYEGYHLNNYPNPFSDGTIIRTYLPDHFDHSEIIVYDIVGNIVKRFTLKSGHNFIEIKSGDIEHGIYFYSLISNGYMIETKKMINL